ncbi:hypothetical protein G9A89_004279 [Geosiphon pyriformis]|nr:hypothetical protein G9A89_004279 [Geosiphon pyriformis]
MKKTIKAFGSEGGFKAVVSRKKKKEGVLKENIDNKGNSDTIESESINIKKKCLVEETSVDYDDNGPFAGEDPDQTPKGLHVKTKKMLGKPLGVINYNTVDAENDVLDDSLLFPSPLSVKSSVQVPVYKSFTLDIDLVVASFTSEKTMIAAAQLANDHGIVVNTNLKHPINNYTNWAIVLKEIPVGTSTEAVRAAISEFEFIKLIKMQLVDVVYVAWADVDKQTWDARDEFRALLYTLSMGTNTYNFWDFIGSVSGKTCVIEYSSVSYIYEKKSAPVSHPLAFGENTWAFMVGKPLLIVFFGGSVQSGSINYDKPLPTVNGELEDHLKNIESSLTSLVEQIGELAQRLDSLGPVVSQPSPECRPPVTPSLQDHVGDVVIGEGSSGTINGGTALKPNLSAFFEVKKLESIFAGLSASVMSLTARLDGLSSTDSGYLGSGVAIIMDITLAKHVYRVSKSLVILFPVANILHKLDRLLAVLSVSFTVPSTSKHNPVLNMAVNTPLFIFPVPSVVTTIS